MCFSLSLLFSTPHPTSDSLFYENGLVDGSVTKKIFMSSVYADAEKRRSLPSDRCAAQLSETTRARR